MFIICIFPIFLIISIELPLITIKVFSPNKSKASLIFILLFKLKFFKFKFFNLLQFLKAFVIEFRLFVSKEDKSITVKEEQFSKILSIIFIFFESKFVKFIFSKLLQFKNVECILLILSDFKKDKSILNKSLLFLNISFIEFNSSLNFISKLK